MLFPFSLQPQWYKFKPAKKEKGEEQTLAAQTYTETSSAAQTFTESPISSSRTNNQQTLILSLFPNFRIKQQNCKKNEENTDMNKIQSRI